MKTKNEFIMTVESQSINESFVRSTVAAFVAQLLGMNQVQVSRREKAILLMMRRQLA